MPGLGELLIILMILLITGLPVLIVLLLVRRKPSAEVARYPMQQYHRAVNDLQSEQEQVRIGAVHMIERMAYEDPAFRHYAWEILQRFVEARRAQSPPEPHQAASEVQAAEAALEHLRDWASPSV